MNLHFFDPRTPQRGHPLSALLRQVAFPLDQRLPDTVRQALQRLSR